MSWYGAAPFSLFLYNIAYFGPSFNQYFPFIAVFVRQNLRHFPLIRHFSRQFVLGFSAFPFHLVP